MAFLSWRLPDLPRLHHALAEDQIHGTMARTRYLVSYDIANPKRLRRVAKTCEEYGTRIQYSVFECPLDELRFQQLRSTLHEIIHHEDDQILFISLGRESSSNPMRIESLGQPYKIKTRVTII